MDEMTAVRDLRADAPTPDRARLAEGRRRLTEEAARGARRWRLRPDWRIAAPVAAAAVTAVALVGALLLPGDTADRPPNPGQGVQRMLDLKDASALLRHAADVVERGPDPEPRKGQWVYEKTFSGNTRYQNPAAEPDTPKLSVKEMKKMKEMGFSTPQDGEWWPYADAAFSNGKEGDDRSPHEVYEFLEGLPEDTDQVLDEVRRYGKVKPGNPPFVTLLGLMDAYPAPPEGMAKVYRALAALDGVEVVDHLVKDAKKRDAIALYWGPEDQGSYLRFETLLDPRTFAAVGERSVITEDGPYAGDMDPRSKYLRAGDVPTNGLVLDRAMVDRKGQRP